MKKRRTAVNFDSALRERTAQTAKQVHALIAGGKTPAPKYTKRCEKCSFFSLCLPKKITKKRVKDYLLKMVLS
jgi:CRISPR-associated exonuclease Cas4